MSLSSLEEVEALLLEALKDDAMPHGGSSDRGVMYWVRADLARAALYRLQAAMAEQTKCVHSWEIRRGEAPGESPWACAKCGIREPKS